MFFVIMTRATRKPSGLPFRVRNDENYYKILQSRPLQVSGITTLVLSSPLSHVGARVFRLWVYDRCQKWQPLITCGGRGAYIGVYWGRAGEAVAV